MWASAPTAAAIASPASAHAFERHRPEDTTLHRVVRGNLQTLYVALEEEGMRLPDFVRAELDGYVGCGILTRGFRLLRCQDCEASQLVALVREPRILSFVPWQANGADGGESRRAPFGKLRAGVLPAAVPLRQWVITFPFSLRSRLAYDGELLGAIGHLFTDSMLGFYRRRVALEGFAHGRSGVIDVVPRVASDLKSQPHVHALALDGVYTASSDDSEPAFHALPRLRTDEVADVLATARIQVTNLLERRDLLEERGDEQTQLVLRADDTLGESEPALTRLAQTAVGTRPPAGPELRRRIALALPERPGVTITSSLCVAEQGWRRRYAPTHRRLWFELRCAHPNRRSGVLAARCEIERMPQERQFDLTATGAACSCAARSTRTPGGPTISAIFSTRSSPRIRDDASRLPHHRVEPPPRRQRRATAAQALAAAPHQPHPLRFVYTSRLEPLTRKSHHPRADTPRVVATRRGTPFAGSLSCALQPLERCGSPCIDGPPSRSSRRLPRSSQSRAPTIPSPAATPPPTRSPLPLPC